ncbi:MAG TPA: hypothetical protein ENH85_09180 [Candidatus Scalindua sp.]|nr:hypothetical protein [Candidatus Scalindua sp.]
MKSIQEERLRVSLQHRKDIENIVFDVFPDIELPPTLIMQCKRELEDMIRRLRCTGNDEFCDELKTIIDKY